MPYIHFAVTSSTSSLRRCHSSVDRASCVESTNNGTIAVAAAGNDTALSGNDMMATTALPRVSFVAISQGVGPVVWMVMIRTLPGPGS